MSSTTNFSDLSLFEEQTSIKMNLNETDTLNKIKNIIENNIDFITTFVNLKLDDMCFHLSLFLFYCLYFQRFLINS